MPDRAPQPQAGVAHVLPAAAISLQRDALLRHLAVAGINATFHFVPLHSSPAGMAATDGVAECPVTDDVSGRLIRLPLYYDLTSPEVDRICESVLQFFEQGRR